MQQRMRASAARRPLCAPRRAHSAPRNDANLRRVQGQAPPRLDSTRVVPHSAPPAPAADTALGRAAAHVRTRVHDAIANVDEKLQPRGLVQARTGKVVHDPRAILPHEPLVVQTEEEDTIGFHDLCESWLLSRPHASIARAQAHASLRPLDFAGMANDSQYQAALYGLSLRAPGLAPQDEVFHPHYAHAMAHFVAAQWRAALAAPPAGAEPQRVFHVLELNAGSGVRVREMLACLAASEPALAAVLRVTVLEPHAELHALQTDVLRDAIAAGQVRVLRESVHEHRGVRSECGVVLALDTLERLPHAKLVEHTRHGLREVRVRAAAGRLQEVHTPPRDARLLMLLDAVAAYVGVAPRAYMATPPAATPPPATLEEYAQRETAKQRRLAQERAQAAALSQNAYLVWVNLVRPLVPGEHFARRFWRTLRSLWEPSHAAFEHAIAYAPTGALQLLLALEAHFPHHSVLLNNAHLLPGATVGLGAPLVQRVRAPAPAPATGPALPALVARSALGSALRADAAWPVLASYTELAPSDAGHADVCFPTNFEQLQLLYRLVGDHCGTPPERTARVHTQEQFMRRHAPPRATRTRSGFAPLLHDYEAVRYAVLPPWH